MVIAVIVVALLVGILVVAPQLAKGNEGAEKALEQVRTYQGFIGLAVGVFGIVALLVFVLGIEWTFIKGVLYMAAVLATTALLIVLGFLLGYQLISDQALSKNEAAKEKGDAFRAKWEPRLTTLGYTVFGLGVLALILHSSLSGMARYMF